MKLHFTAAVIAALCLPLPALAWEASVVPSTRKVVPTSSIEYEKTTSANLAGCRNEWEAFQIVINAPEPVSGVNVAVSALSDGNGNEIPASAFTLYREWFLNVVNPSGAGWGVPNHERVAGLYPDPLIPFVDPYSEETVPVAAPFDITEANPGLAVVWADVRIPGDAVPGVYTGTATVTAKDQPDLQIPVSLEVWEIDMPLERNVGTAFRMSESQVRRYHGGKDPANTDANLPDIIRNYYVAGHDHRMDPTGFTGPVDFTFDEGGNLQEVDWTGYDAYMTPYVDGGYFPDGIGVARFDVGLFGPGRGRSMTDEQYKQASSALANHLDEKGWMHKAWVYAKDEPWLVNPLAGDTQEEADAEMAAVAADSRLLVEGNDLWKGKVLVTGPSWEEAKPWVGIWCPVHPMFGKWWWTDRDYAGRGDYDAHIQAGGELWFYNCNANVPPFAGYDIDTSIGYEPRILKWGSWFEGATGYLYWRQLYWGYFDPWLDWQSIEHFSALFARNGDGLLMYPGDGNGYLLDDNDNPVEPGTPEWLHIDGPVVSFRMKQIREGLEDWELFILAEKAGLGDWTRAEVARAYSSFGAVTEQDCSKEFYYCPDREPWTLDESVLFDVRSRVAAKLLFTMYPEKYTDPDAPIVSEEVGDDILSSETMPADAAIADEGDLQEVSDATTPGDTAADTDTDDVKPSGNGCAATTSNTNPLTWLILALCLIATRIPAMRRIREKRASSNYFDRNMQ